MKPKNIEPHIIKKIISLDSEFSEMPYENMIQFIDGPYNPATDFEIDSGNFESEYEIAYNIVKESLQIHGIEIEGKNAVFLGEVGRSRFFPFYLGSDFEILDKVVQGAFLAITKINNMGLCYGFGIALGWNIGRSTTRMYVGISKTTKAYCIIKE